jgi:hypothetical protein
MTGTDTPDAPPPEVPEEFADAYREAYRRALESGGDPELLTGPPTGPPTGPLTGPPDELPPHEVVRTGPADWRSARWFLPAVIGASGLVLVLAAYLLGNVLSSDDEPSAATPSAARTTPGPSGSSSVKPPKETPTKAPGGWEGAVAAVSVDAIAADCTAPPSRDSAGRKVTYVPANATDGKADTAWRCPGTAVGEQLTLRLGGETDVAEVGLVPGYAKTDPESGVDRYAENNRITRVRWTLGDGESFVQRLDPNASSRALQLLRVPRTVTDTITLEILRVARGPRNTTAISEIAIRATE